MDTLERLLQHDSWTTKQLLDICATLPSAKLDFEHDIGHQTLRRTLDHIIHNMETWTALMTEGACQRSEDQTIPGMTRRLAAAETKLRSLVTRVSEEDAWDEFWLDTLSDPPQRKRFSSAIAHLITHSMHHRAQLLYMLRLSGIEDLPEGDVFTWEEAAAD